MKKIFYVAVAALLVSSCEREITSLNSNPKQAETVPSKFAFTSAEYDMLNTIYNPGTQSNAYHFLTQQLAETTYVTPSKFSLDTNSSNHWDLMYVRGLKMLQNAKNTLATEFDASSPSGKNKWATIEVLTVLGFQNLVDTYGDVPYTDALQQEQGKLSPKYDKAAIIYADLIKRLDAAIASMDTASPGYAEDFLYKGNMAKWKKFANTVKFGLGLNLADVDPTVAKRVCEEAYNSGMLASNDDNAYIPYDGSNYKNPFSTTREDIVASKTYVDKLVEYNDPRLEKYFTKKGSSVVGGVFGKQNTYSSTSTFNTSISAGSAKGLFLDYSQSEFWLAEGAARGYNVGPAVNHFTNAISASLDYWGVDATSKASYLAANPYNSAGDFKKQIGIQSWLAGFAKGYFTWNTVRRLDAPVLANPVTSVLTSYPYRLSYPNGEQNLNAANWSAAASAIPGGKDTPTAHVFWDKF